MSNDERVMDVVRVMRKETFWANGERRHDVERYVREYADRIEAALKLDKSDAIKAAMMAKCEVCRDVQGNTAAMRQALEGVLRYLGNIIPTQSELALMRQAKTALAAPPRNCDRFATQEEAWNYYFEHIPDNGNIIDGFAVWLFATELIYGDAKAANKEGGKKQ